ncbi:MAG: hypothetical protein GX577_01905, partial [Leptolinea sp.]|nr:hypothetical protein [Leptolinea sp.]
MSVSVWKLTFNNQNYELFYVGKSVNLDEASGKLAQGVFTTFRTYQHSKVLRFEDHIERLESSSSLQGRSLALDRALLSSAIKEVLEVFSGSNARIRIHCAFEKECIDIFLMGEAFLPYPDEIYVKGVSVRSVNFQRDNPASKATSFITQTRELRAGKPREIHEYIMVDNAGQILEGLTCNVFILREGIVWTANEGVLPGITRQTVLDTVSLTGIGIHYGGYPVNELNLADEVFITSASRGVMPVTEFDGTMIGSGKPGQVTQQIKSLFE